MVEIQSELASSTGRCRRLEDAGRLARQVLEEQRQEQRGRLEAQQASRARAQAQRKQKMREECREP